MTRKNFFSYYNENKYRLLFRWIDIEKVKFIKNLVKNSNRLKILDLGTGDSSILNTIRQHKFFAGDINFSLLKLCKSKNPFVYCCQFDGDYSLPFKDKTFDIILSVDSIEHIKFPHNLVSESKRLLKPNGSFIVFTPPYDSVQWVIAEKFHNLITQSNSDHITPFTRESLQFLLQTYFSNVTIKKMNCGLTLCGVAREISRKD